MSKLQTVKLADIDANPFRKLDAYPFVETKIATLMRSYADVGMWEGVIGRTAGNRIEIAFGHHRMEAAKRTGMEHAPVIVRDLTDEDMLKFMGRENGEDYNADFLCMLETWEAAKTFLKNAEDRRKKVKVIDIARLLGWTEVTPSRKTDDCNPTADACSAASQLIEDGSFDRAGFEGLNVSAAREIAGQVVATKKTIDKVAKKTGMDAEEATSMKKAADKGGKEALDKVKSGDETAKTAKTRVGQKVRETKAFKKSPPMIEDMLYGMVKGIDKMLNDDAAGKKLEEVSETLRIPDLELNAAGVGALLEVRGSLGLLSGRAGGYEKEFAAKKKRAKKTAEIIPLQIEGEAS